MNKEYKKLDSQEKEILKNLKEAIDTVERSAENPEFDEIKKSVQSRIKEEYKNHKAK